jgi:hypothetical protein
VPDRRSGRSMCLIPSASPDKSRRGDVRLSSPSRFWTDVSGSGGDASNGIPMCHGLTAMQADILRSARTLELSSAIIQPYIVDRIKFWGRHPTSDKRPSL